MDGGVGGPSDAARFEDAANSDADGAGPEDGGFLCGEPVVRVEPETAFPELLELRLENPAPMIGGAAVFVGRVRDEGSGIAEVLIALDNADHIPTDQQTDQIGPDGHFSIAHPVDRCSRYDRAPVTYIVVADRAGNITSLQDFDGDGMFDVLHGQEVVGQRDLGIMVVTATATRTARALLRYVSIERSATGIGVHATIEGADECAEVRVSATAQPATATGPCYGRSFSGGQLLLGSDTDLEIPIPACAATGPWVVDRISLSFRDRRLDSLLLEDPDGLLPLTIDLGGALAVAQVPRLIDLTFEKESRPEGTVLHGRGRSDFSCSAQGSIHWVDSGSGARTWGQNSLRSGSFESCTFIGSHEPSGVYSLEGVSLSPDFGCALSIQVANGRWEDRSRPPSGSELPATVPQFSHP